MLTTKRIPPVPSQSAVQESIKSLFRLQGDDGQAAESHMMMETAVSFVDNAAGDAYIAEQAPNPIATADGTPDLSLGSFLARPTEINTFTWTTSNPIGVTNTIQPWDLFMNNALIKRKIDNYPFLRGRLHVKVVINATPFQYGCMRVCYSPLLGYVSDKIRTNPTSDLPLRVPYSQQPGAYLSPQSNRGAELELPFFFHENWLNITQRTNVQNFGTLRYVIFAPLDVASASGPTSVTVRTLAWMTDVELMGSTTSLALQGDEYGNGPVSRPATVIAGIASQLTNIPILGKFAKATQIGASAVSTIASLFGFTNVPNINNVEPMYIMSAPHLASAEISTPVQKLALDPKQELSLDTSYLGGSLKDELALTHLLQKESFFADANWTSGALVGDTLFNARITPSLRDIVTLSIIGTPVGLRSYDTVLSYNSNLFKHWRGTIKIRMKVVCTKFHKGRLKVSYDPVSDISVTEPGTNAVYTQIIDIGEQDDVILEIPYHQALAWLEVENDATVDWTQGTALAPRYGKDNGTLSVRVFSTLEAPVASAIKLLFYVSAGDSFEFTNPTTNIGLDINDNVPSFFALQGDDTVDEGPVTLTFGTDTSVDDHRYDQNFGEAILSLRKLLHRSQLVDTVIYANTATSNSWNFLRKWLKRMPYTPGYTPESFPTVARDTLGVGSFSFCYNTMHMIPFISGMFMGYRGGVNYTITPITANFNVDDIRVLRTTDTFPNVTRWYEANGSVGYLTSISNKALVANRQRMPYDGLGGAAVTSNRTSSTVQVNIPDYNNRNFSLVDPTKYIAGSSTDGTDVQGAMVCMNLFTSATDSTSTQGITVFAGAGPDFTTLYFNCCPTLDYSLLPPAPP